MATLRELAELTGFSITTISRVLNDDPTMSVSEATRAAILEAAGRLHYRSAPHRSKIASSPRFAVAEMLSPAQQLADPYYLYLRTYTQQRCHDMGYTLLPLPETEDGYRLDGAVDGILAIGIFSETQIERLSALTRNLVFLDSAPDELRFASVVLNFPLGIHQAVEDLTARGHRRVGFLGPEGKLDQRKRPAAEVRRQCFIQELRARGLYDPTLLINAQMNAPDARAAVLERIRSHGPMPTALLCANEEAAIGAVSAARELGLRIPEDLSIISFNDTVLSALTDPPLTSVSTHVEAMSAMAVDLLARRCADPEQLPVKIVIPPTLIQRESVRSL